jgi:hypothetical protein
MTRFAIPGLDMAGGVERVPDRSLVLDDATETRIHGLLAGGRWLHLSVSDNAKVRLAAWLPASAVRFLKVKAAKADPDRLLFGAMLVRPDGYSAGQTGPSL